MLLLGSREPNTNNLILNTNRIFGTALFIDIEELSCSCGRRNILVAVWLLRLVSTTLVYGPS